MWQRRVESQIVAGWQRQFQYGEGADYFSKWVPWVDASRPAVPGLRKMVVDNLGWLERTMQERAAAGKDTGFIAGTTAYSVVDLQLVVTADFMGDKVNHAKQTESFDARTSFGPWLNEWAGRMRTIVAELEEKASKRTGVVLTRARGGRYMLPRGGSRAAPRTATRQHTRTVHQRR